MLPKPPRCSTRLVWISTSFWLVGCSVDTPIGAERQPDPLRRHATETLLQTKGYYGIPILQKSLLWDGNGEVDDAGVGVHVAHFVTDDVALGAGINAGAWLLPGADSYSAELEGLLRIYPFGPAPVFLEGTGGFQQATKNVPPGGTDWNFSFGFGPGMEVPIAHGCDLEFGVGYHHISNALGRDNDRNPSQNEARVWVGLAWTL
jgi:hypothetical protein